MAEQLLLSDAYGSISLNSATGISVLYGGGNPQRAPDPDARVIDTYRCSLTGSSDDNLASQLISLNRMLENAKRYDQDSTEENEVWLTEQLEAETNPRYSLVLGGAWQFDRNPHSQPTRSTYVAFVTLAIKRMAFYESGSVSAGPYLDGSVITSASLTVFGGTSSLSALAYGDVPARVQAVIKGRDGSIETIWAGFRSWRKESPFGAGTLHDHFTPIWESELGTFSNGASATSTYNASATGSSASLAVIVGFSDALWAERVVLTAHQVNATYDSDQIGRFLVLGRMRLDTGADTVQARLRSGYYTTLITPQYKTLDPVTISGSDFQYYEFGTVKFPPIQGILRTPLGSIGTYNMALSLVAARTSGSTSKLIIDHYALVPIDEGFFKVSGLALSSANYLLIGSTPKNVPLSAFDASASGISSSIPTSQQNFYMPFNAGRIYYFAQRLNLSVIGDTLDSSVYIWPRYYSLRGAS